MNIREQIINIFEENYLNIVQDPFGNYAIQFAIDNFGSIPCKKIIEKICEDILILSLQKFSSNVIEKCIENTDEVKFFLNIIDNSWKN